MPAATRRLLQAAAALHDPTVTAVAQATGCDRADLAPAAGQGIIRLRGEAIRFDDPLLASAAYSDGDPAALRGLHARLAEVVTDPDERLWQAALGAEQPDARLADAVAAAAGRLRHHGRPASAAELAEAAVRLTPPTRTGPLARRLRAAGAHHLAAGDEQHALRLFERAASAAPPGDQRAAALADLARAHGYAGSLPRAAVLFEVALGEATGLASRSVIHRDAAWVLALLGDPAAGEHARSAVALAEAADDPLAVATGLAVAALAGTLACAAPDPDLLERAVRLEATAGGEELAALPVLCRPTLVAALVDVRSGRPELARAVLYRLERDLVLRDDACALAVVHTVIAEFETAVGDCEKAERYATAALEAP